MLRNNNNSLNRNDSNDNNYKNDNNYNDTLDIHIIKSSQSNDIKLEESEWTVVKSKPKSKFTNNKRKFDSFEVSSDTKINVKKFHKNIEVWEKVLETWENYQNTLKYIDITLIDGKEKNCDWVYRIFEGKQELDNVLCVTKEFLIVTNNIKTLRAGNKLNPTKFTLVVLLFDLEIRTLRDLEQKHIGVLLQMKQKALQVIKNHLDNFYSDEKKLSFEFHYTPSTYQLHLNVKFNARPEIDENRKHRIHLLDTVIENLKSDSDYYKKPIEIYVRDKDNWEKNLLFWSGIELEIVRTNKFNPETCDFWKFFEHLDCYKNYIN